MSGPMRNRRVQEDYDWEMTGDRKMAGDRTFKELYLDGKVEFEAIDDYSYEWGMGEDERTLARYLGLNEEEEDAWISTGEDALREMLDAQKR